jgi:hypothetical protein
MDVFVVLSCYKYCNFITIVGCLKIETDLHSHLLWSLRLPSIRAKLNMTANILTNTAHKATFVSNCRLAPCGPASTSVTSNSFTTLGYSGLWIINLHSHTRRAPTPPSAEDHHLPQLFSARLGDYVCWHTQHLNSGTGTHSTLSHALVHKHLNSRTGTYSTLIHAL